MTLPVLDALFSDEAFKSALKSKIQITDEQVMQLQKVAADEVARLREANIEAKTTEEQLFQMDESRAHATEAIRNVIGEQKLRTSTPCSRLLGERKRRPGDSPGPRRRPRQMQSCLTQRSAKGHASSSQHSGFPHGCIPGRFLVTIQDGIGYPSFRCRPAYEKRNNYF